MRIARVLAALILSFFFTAAMALAQSPRRLSDLPPEAQAKIREALSHRASTGALNAKSVPAPTDGPWAQLAQPISTLASSGVFYGAAVAVSGNTVVVTETIISNGSGNGEAFVFLKPANGNWNNLTQSAVLVPSDGLQSDAFGTSVAISGNTIVVGSPPSSNCPGCSVGRAYVYVEPSGGWTGQLTETAELTASDAADGAAVGSAVSISGNTAVVGAPGEQPGAAYVYVESANGWSNMSQTAKLTASDGIPTDLFGTSVSVSDNTIVVGAPYATGNSSPSGAAYVFVEPANGWQNMTQTAELLASDSVAYAALGQGVGIDGNTVVAGAPFANGVSNQTGAGYIFVEPNGGWSNETQAAKLVAPDGQKEDECGFGAGISGNTVVIGAPQRSRGPSNPFGIAFLDREGGAYVFTNSGSGWMNPSVQLLTGSDAHTFDLLGSSVGIDGRLAVTGAPYLGKYLGGAFIFVRP